MVSTPEIEENPLLRSIINMTDTYADRNGGTAEEEESDADNKDTANTANLLVVVSVVKDKEKEEGERQCSSVDCVTSEYGSLPSPSFSWPAGMSLLVDEDEQEQVAAQKRDSCASQSPVDPSWLENWLRPDSIERNLLVNRQVSLNTAVSTPMAKEKVNATIEKKRVENEQAQAFSCEELAELAEALKKPIVKPAGDYVCHVCYAVAEHKIYDCPKRHQEGMREDTPYQGAKRCYGEFACEQCKRKWYSGNSFAQMAQQCVKCKVNVFPRKQLPLQKAIQIGKWAPSSAAGARWPAGVGSPLQQRPHSTDYESSFGIYPPQPASPTPAQFVRPRFSPANRPTFY